MIKETSGPDNLREDQSLGRLRWYGKTSGSAEAKRRLVMVRSWTAGTLLAVCTTMTLPALVLAQMQSVDEALALSRKTGRPVFALAGNRT